MFYDRSENPSEMPISIHLMLIGKRAGDLTRGGTKTPVEFEIKEGDALSSGDYFRIKLRPDEDAHVYVLFYDSTGKVSKLFSDKIISI